MFDGAIPTTPSAAVSTMHRVYDIATLEGIKMTMAEQETRTISIRVPAVVAVALERVAASQDRSLSAEVRRLLRRHVEEAEDSMAA
jgi:hypothetical protein